MLTDMEFVLTPPWDTTYVRPHQCQTLQTQNTHSDNSSWTLALNLQIALGSADFQCCMTDRTGLCPFLCSFHDTPAGGSVPQRSSKRPRPPTPHLNDWGRDELHALYRRDLARTRDHMDGRAQTVSIYTASPSPSRLRSRSRPGMECLVDRRLDVIFCFVFPSSTFSSLPTTHLPAIYTFSLPTTQPRAIHTARRQRLPHRKIFDDHAEPGEHTFQRDTRLSHNDDSELEEVN